MQSDCGWSFDFHSAISAGSTHTGLKLILKQEYHSEDIRLSGFPLAMLSARWAASHVSDFFHLAA